MPFSVDHFSNNLERWNRHVKPLQPKASLVIGCHEGRAALWLLENCAGSNVTCIENFRKVGVRIEKNFSENVAPYKTRVRVMNKSYREALVSLAHSKKIYDFIFIDSIDSLEVLECMVLAFPLLKPKGLFIVDDYTNSKERIPNCPRAAVDAFMNVYAPCVKALEYSWQAIFLKRSRKLPWPKCQSEYYHEDLNAI
jgi:predicted O-methyltransferase YrrM